MTYRPLGPAPPYEMKQDGIAARAIELMRAKPIDELPDHSARKLTNMKISNAFPSEYLRAADLQGRNVRVLIDRVEMTEIGTGEHKPVAYFKGKDKGLILNKTNANNIANVYGDDTDEWDGKELVLFEAMVDFQGKTMPAIRVRAPTAKDRQQRPAAPPPPPNDSQMYADEEVPF